MNDEKLNYLIDEYINGFGINGINGTNGNGVYCGLDIANSAINGNIIDTNPATINSSISIPVNYDRPLTIRDVDNKVLTEIHTNDLRTIFVDCGLNAEEIINLIKQHYPEKFI